MLSLENIVVEVTSSTSNQQKRIGLCFVTNVSCDLFTVMRLNPTEIYEKIKSTEDIYKVDISSTQPSHICAGVLFALQ